MGWGDHRSFRIASAAVLVFALALCAAPLYGHSDEVDSHTYTVLARHMAENGRWLDPAYLPSIFPRFREHLPFGIWPFALTIRALGERALAPVALMFSLGTLSIMLLAGAGLFGRSAALVGVLVLCTTDSFFQTAGRVHLDDVLLLLTTASTLPLWAPRRVAPAWWASSAALSALAVLVKGPFGLLPLVTTIFARALALRSAREILIGGTAALAALLPVAMFLGYDALLGQGTWWRGYVLDQLCASAYGSRRAGATLMPLTSLAGRFWPGLPLSIWGLALGLRDLVRRKPTVVAIAAAHVSAGLALLFLPARKLPHHNFVFYPALALLAGAAVAPAVERLVASTAKRRAAVVAMVAVAAGAAVASLAGAGAFLTPRFCVIPPRLAGSLPPGADVLVVAPDKDWVAIAALAAEYRVNGWPTRALGGDVPLAGARFALVRADGAAVAPAEWQKRATEGSWTLWATNTQTGGAPAAIPFQCP